MTEAHHEAFAELPEMNPGPVLRLNLEGTIELANRAARASYDVAELVGRNWMELCPQLSQEMWEQVVLGGESVRCNAELRGRVFMFTLAHRPGSRNVFVYGSDITELKRAQAKLEEQAAREREMAQFPEMNPGPVCRLDTDGRIVLANRATRALLGREDVQGESWLDLCPGVDHAFFERVLASPGRHAIEARIGGREYVFTHVRAPSGKEVFVYGADVTEEKAAERTVLQTEKMATLGTLAAGVAHELNNPAAAAQRAAGHLREDFAQLQQAEMAIDAIDLSNEERQALPALHEHARAQAGCACDLDGLKRTDLEEAVEAWLQERGVPEPWDRALQLVELNFKIEDLDRLAQRLRPEHLAPVLLWFVHLHSVYRLMEQIRHGAARISEIVGAMRSYSYLGRAPVQDVDVNEGLRQTLIIMRSKLKNGVQVVQELATDLPRIRAFGGELNQVWTNLIDNAVGAMNGVGRIVLKSFRDGDSVVIEVQDDGPGIPPDIVSRIFDPFFTTKGPGQGTGLGLHTCRSIVVKRHGGSLDVASRAGETRFTVRLPIDGPAVAAHERAPDGARASEDTP